MANPSSSDALKAFQWKGKRLAMKFEGGWSTASYKRACTRREAPEGYHLFRYQEMGDYYRDLNREQRYSKT
jgi:hypothetical protein